MTNLEQLIDELCPDGVEYITIDNLISNKIITVITPTIKVKRKNYLETGKTPIVSQELEHISGYCDLIDKNIPCANYVCFGDHSEHIKYVDFAFVQGADGLKIMRPNEITVSARYLFHAISNFYQRHNNYERHFKYLTDTTIPVPPLPVQREIVRILDNFTELTAELTTELTARKKQYEYYRRCLIQNADDMQELSLGEIATLKTGNKPAEVLATKTDYEYINAGTSLSGYVNGTNCEGDVATTPSRGQGGIGFVGYQKKPFWLGPLCYRIKSKDTTVVTNRYLYYYLSCFNEKILAYKKEGGTPAVNASDLANIIIVIPSISEQERIVEILDRFDALCNDISDGLPAEIEARQKQYEYYRDKLLSFKELNA